MKLTNHAGRALGVPGAHGSIVVKSKESVDISPLDLEAIKRNKTASSWLSKKVISVDGEGAVEQEEVKKQQDQDQEPLKKAKGIARLVPKSGGWYQVFVGDIEVSQGNMRKAAAEKLLAQYQE